MAVIRKKEANSRQPILAKLWWASLPVFIAAQGWVTATPLARQGQDDSYFSTPHFWPISDDAHSFSRRDNHEIVDETAATLLPSAQEQRFSKRQQLSEEQSNIDWFGQKEPGSTRFQVPERIAQVCNEQQPCHFHPTDKATPVQERPYLCKRELVAKVAAVATQLCCGASCESYTAHWEPEYLQGKFSSPNNFARRDCQQASHSKSQSIPIFACDGHRGVCNSQGHYCCVSSSAASHLPDRELRPVVTTELSHIPQFACATSYDVEANTPANSLGTDWSVHGVLSAVHVCPEPITANQLTPPFACSQELTSLARTTAELDLTLHLHDQILLSRASAITPIDIATTHREEARPRTIPYLLCEGCDATTGHPSYEEQRTTGAWGLANSEITDIANELGPFITIPKTLCANCDLLSPSQEHSFALAADAHNSLAHGADDIVYGAEREEYDPPASASSPDRPWNATAHLVQPLGSQTVVAQAWQERSAEQFAVAASPSLIAMMREHESCIGVECLPEPGNLTKDHPTAALAAFDGTGYKSIDDLCHRSPLSSGDLAPTDPSLYCDKITMGLTAVEANAIAFLEAASKAFWRLAKDTRLSNDGSSKDPARGAPDPKSWGVPRTSAATEQPIIAQASLQQEQSEALEPEENSDFWVALDHLVDAKQPSEAPLLSGVFGKAIGQVASNADTHKDELLELGTRVHRQLSSHQYPSVSTSHEEALASGLESLQQKRVCQPLETDPDVINVPRNPVDNRSLCATSHPADPKQAPRQISLAVNDRNLVTAAKQLPDTPIAVSPSAAEPEHSVVHAPDYEQLLLSVATEALPPARERVYNKPVVTQEIPRSARAKHLPFAKNEQSVALEAIEQANQRPLVWRSDAPQPTIGEGLIAANAADVNDSPARSDLFASWLANIIRDEQANALAAIEQANQKPLTWRTDVLESEIAEWLAAAKTSEPKSDAPVGSEFYDPWLAHVAQNEPLDTKTAATAQSPTERQNPLHPGIKEWLIAAAEESTLNSEDTVGSEFYNPWLAHVAQNEPLDTKTAATAQSPTERQNSLHPGVKEWLIAAAEESTLSSEDTVGSEFYNPWLAHVAQNAPSNPKEVTASQNLVAPLQVSPLIAAVEETVVSKDSAGPEFYGPWLAHIAQNEPSTAMTARQQALHPDIKSWLIAAGNGELTPDELIGTDFYGPWLAHIATVKNAQLAREETAKLARDKADQLAKDQAKRVSLASRAEVLAVADVPELVEDEPIGTNFYGPWLAHIAKDKEPGSLEAIARASQVQIQTKVEELANSEPVLPSFYQRWLVDAEQKAAAARLASKESSAPAPLFSDASPQETAPSTLANAESAQAFLGSLNIPTAPDERSLNNVTARAVSQPSDTPGSELFGALSRPEVTRTVAEQGQKVLAQAQPAVRQQDLHLSQDAAQALGLNEPGLASSKEMTEFDLLANEDSNATHTHTSTLIGREALHNRAAAQAGRMLSKDAACKGDIYSTCESVGEATKPAFDAAAIKQISATVQPQDHSNQPKRKHPDLWSMSPGPGSQTVTPSGKVPGGFDIASGRTGQSRPVELEGQAAQVHALQGGYHYYIGEGTTPAMSSSLDHLQVSGALTQLPGTSSEAPWEGLSREGQARDRIGISENKAKNQHSLLSFAPSIDGAWAIDSRALPETKKVNAAIALNSMSDDGATAKSDQRLGKELNKIVKVVDVDAQSQRAISTGKVANNERDLHQSDPYARHRFAVEVVPHADSRESNQMHLLVGHAPIAREASPHKDSSASFFIDFAHAAEVMEVGAGREPASFLSVGAPVYPLADRDWDDSAASRYTIGAGNNLNDELVYDDHSISAPQGEPGLDPFGRKPTALGVRREGRLWDDNRPWFDDEEQQNQLTQADTSYQSAPQHNKFEGRRPPDKAGQAPSNWANPIASSEASANSERELDGSLQKKNRTLESKLERGEESRSNVPADTATDIPCAPLSESDDEATEQSNANRDSFVTGWQSEHPADKVVSQSKAPNLVAEQPVDTVHTPETLFNSGVSSTSKKVPEATPTHTDTNAHATAKDEAHEPEGLLINFRDVAITEYIRFVAQQTGRNFVFNDKDLQFHITIISEQPTSLDNIVAALLQELRIHGLRVIEQDNSIIIHANDKTKSPARVIKGDQKDTHETQLVTRVFQLDSIPADKMKDVVVPMLSTQALVQVLPDTNNLLITDFGMNVEKIADLIRTLDRPTTAFQIGQYVGRNNFIENLIPLAEEIIKPFAEKHQVVFVPHLSTNSVFIVSSPILVKRAIGILEQLDSLEGTTKILTLEDLVRGGTDLINQKKPEEQQQHIVRRPKTEQELEEEAREKSEKEKNEAKSAQNLLKEQNAHEQAAAAKPPEEKLPQDHLSQTKFYIHKLQYREGDQLQGALTRIGDSLRLSEKANIDLINTINSSAWIASSNSLVVTGPPESLERVRELIEEIDVPLRQVFLEMLILDTTIQDSLTFAVDFASQFSGTGAGGAQAFIGDTPATGSTGNVLLSAVNAAASSTLVSAATLAAGTTLPGYNIGIIGRRILKGGQFFETMGALVQAVHQDTETEILLNPKIMVEDNREAEIFVGDNIAFQTQNVVNDSGSIISQNVQFRDIGTTLKVRVMIGNNDVVTLDIREEVSNVSSVQSGTVGSAGSGTGGSTGSNTATSPGPTTQTSRTITRVHVPNECFCVLSGLIRDQKVRSRVQLPCLGGLPIIGAFCSRIDPSSSKRNLMIFIRPIIIDTEWDFNNITKRQQNIYKDKGKMKPRWKYEADEGLDFLNLPRINEHCIDESYLPGWGDECD